MKLSRLMFALIPFLLAATSASGRDLAIVEVYDRTDGRTLPIYEHDGRLYVAGEPRHQYELRIRNQCAARVLAVTSVDGVNVVTGKTAAEHQSGYVIDPWDLVEIEGWRKSLDDVATFYFTRLENSYAARTGRPENVGVIGVALFRERRSPRCTPYLDESAAGAAAPSAKAAEPEVARDSLTAERRAESSLGTGHGHRESSPAQYVDFQRTSSTPDETIVIYYDSRKNLVAQGVLPQQRPWLADRRPRPFPDGFVPDP